MSEMIKSENVCFDCGVEFGNKEVEGTEIKWKTGKCMICEKDRGVTEASNYFHNGELEKAINIKKHA
jgi:hypothetical protein